MSGTRKHVAVRSAKPNEDELLQRFRSVLHFGHADLVMRLWNQHIKIRQAYAGKSQLSFSDIVFDFGKLINLEITPIIDYIWRDNKKLHAWFCHEQVDGKYIEWHSLIEFFECTVLHGQANIANAIIRKRCSNTLQAWYEGRPFDMSAGEEPAYVLPSDDRTIQTIGIFKASLFFSMMPVVQGIWNAGSSVMLAYYKNLFSSNRDLFENDFLFYSQYPDSKIMKELILINQRLGKHVEVKIEIEIKEEPVEMKRKAEEEVEDCAPRKKLKREHVQESSPTVSPPATPAQLGFFSESALISEPPVVSDDLLPQPPLTQEQLDMMFMYQVGY